MSILSKYSNVMLYNGLYKSIADVEENDIIMNMWLEPVIVNKIQIVNNVKMTEINYNNWYCPLYCSQNTNIIINNKQDDVNKIRLESVDKLNNDIIFKVAGETPFIDNFTYKFTDKINLTPSYDLGYIFGMYIGFGYINSGLVHFIFGPNETLLETMKNYLSNLFDIQVLNEKMEGNNIIICKSKELVKLFTQFGFNLNKTIPREFLCNNVDYIKGIFDGLIEYDINTNICKFMTMSEKIAQLFILLCNMLNLPCENDSNILNDTVVYNFIIRYTDSSVMGKVNTIVKDKVECDGYMLDVDCDTKSIVVNGIIVKLN
jgi:hypothetical protein